MLRTAAINQTIRPFTLNFADSKLEMSFRASYCKKMLPQVRNALIAAATIYVAFMILDLMVLTEGQSRSLLIRFVFVLPIFMLAYYATYKNYFRKRIQLLVIIVIYLAGMGLAAIRLKYNVSQSDLYLMGTIFPIFWAFIYSGLRFINAFIVSVALLLSYNLVYFTISPVSLPVIVTYNFFLITALLIGSLGGYTIENYYRRDYVNQKLLAAQKLENERLLLNILPRNIANELKLHEGTIARDYAQITVLFADLVNFSRFSLKHNAQHVVKILNDIFSLFDELTDRYHLEKIKTIGDAYMVTSNLQDGHSGKPQDMAKFALEILQALQKYNEDNNQSIQLRIGMHTGPAVAGVIGVKKFVYDVWGNTVNVASRMESTCPAGKIQVSQSSYDQLKASFVLEPQGNVDMKGFGSMPAYIMLAKRANSAAA